MDLLILFTILRHVSNKFIGHFQFIFHYLSNETSKCQDDSRKLDLLILFIILRHVLTKFIGHYQFIHPYLQHIPGDIRMPRGQPGVIPAYPADPRMNFPQCKLQLRVWSPQPPFHWWSFLPESLGWRSWWKLDRSGQKLLRISHLRPVMWISDRGSWAWWR